MCIQLILLKELFAACYENYLKRLNTLRGQIADFILTSEQAALRSLNTALCGL